MIRQVCLLQVLILCVSKVSSFLPTSNYATTATTSVTRRVLLLQSPCTIKIRAVPGADIEQPQSSTAVVENESPAVPEATAAPSRGKVNEIDFCIAPADVSLSRSYSNSDRPPLKPNGNSPLLSSNSLPVLSLTRALNNASNRVVRRILLARAWPSAEALNKSFRQAAAAEKAREAAAMAAASSSAKVGAKCPVPRPILNLLVRRRANADANKSFDTKTATATRTGKSRSDEEYVADQLQAFQEKYGGLPGYQYAEAYLESILSLATSGKESPRVKEVMESGVYDESYRKVVGVIRTVGAVFEGEPQTGTASIAPLLLNQDTCLSMLDKISLRKEKEKTNNSKRVAADGGIDASAEKDSGDDELKGGLLLSAKEPTMTRELNSLSNIVQRALLFGGDQELLVLFETLVADRDRFVERWYPNTGGVDEEAELEDETRSGVQYFNCLIKLLSQCYNDGAVTTLDPPFPLIESYNNAYGRLMATLVELGSGYVKSAQGNVLTMMPKPRNSQEELGRFAVWETSFRKNAGKDGSSYPEDLEGTWEVQDLIGFELIGVSTVVFNAHGQVVVEPPLEGLRWRLDPGPTHLDTCTFQVLSDDKTILQYRGFIDRGARLESRFSKRPIKIRGSVMFQMRDGESAMMGEGYWKDMLPFNYRTGTTKFVMTKKSR